MYTGFYNVEERGKKKEEYIYIFESPLQKPLLLPSSLKLFFIFVFISFGWLFLVSWSLGLLLFLLYPSPPLPPLFVSSTPAKLINIYIVMPRTPWTLLSYIVICILF
ncbi:hypothetical protein F4703DRAFT_1075796 [Phycomyces blakesleeanus]